MLFVYVSGTHDLEQSSVSNKTVKLVSHRYALLNLVLCRYLNILFPENSTFYDDLMSL